MPPCQATKCRKLKKDSDYFIDLEDDGFLTLYPHCPAGEYPTFQELRKADERLKEVRMIYKLPMNDNGKEENRS